MIALTFILACILLFTDYRCTAQNMAVQWNGFGCIKAVNAGQSVAPMQYRVLVPWIYRLIPLRDSKGKYMILKGIAIWFALHSFHLYLLAITGSVQLSGVLLLAAVLPAFMRYDYTDCYFELGFMSLALAVSTWGQQYLLWLVVITLLATLNRETGVFIPIIYFIMTWGLFGTAVLFAVFVVAYIIPRAYYGKKSRYCDATMFKRNWAELKGLGFYNILFFGLMAWFGASMFVWGNGDLFMISVMMVLFTGVMLVPSIWTEIRVFMPLLLVTIPKTIMWMGL